MQRGQKQTPDWGQQWTLNWAASEQERREEGRSACSVFRFIPEASSGRCCFLLLDSMSYPCIFPISAFFIIILKILSWMGLSSLQPRTWRNFLKLQQFFVRKVELWVWFLPPPPLYSLLQLLLFFLSIEKIFRSPLFFSAAFYSVIWAPKYSENRSKEQKICIIRI